jgi:hypothetical protein
MRNPIACVPCRTAKLKCSHRNQPPCDRCRAGGKAEVCHFPQRWTSALHRQPKKRHQRRGNLPHPNQERISGLDPLATESNRPSGPSSSNFTGNPHTVSGGGINPEDQVDGQLSHNPLEWLTDEVQNSYLRCSYKWSFHHKPTLLRKIRDGTIDQAMAWAILALASR